MTIVGGPIEIFLVEDNAGDVRFIEEVLEEAILFLHGEGKFSGSPRPYNSSRFEFAKKDGEVLKEVIEDSNFKKKL